MSLSSFILEYPKDLEGRITALYRRGIQDFAAFNNWIVRDALFFDGPCLEVQLPGFLLDQHWSDL